MANSLLIRSLQSRWRTTVGLIIREFKSQRAGARFGFLAMLFEMAAAILVLALIFTLIGRQAQFGTSIMLFMFSGIVPFLTFMRVSGAVGGAAQSVSPPVRSPLITVVSVAIARSISILVIASLTAVILCMVFITIGIADAFPARPLFALGSLVTMTALGFGVGLFNTVVGYFFPGWLPTYNILTRGSFILSGIFYVADTLPVPARDIIEWNPLLHGVIMFRMGFYENYPTLVWDPVFYGSWVYGAVFVGMWAERLFRRHMV